MKGHNSKKSFNFAVFGGGCFWCIESVFAEIRGIKKVTSGYAGGYPKEGADIGSQYRSVILHTNENQKKEADEFIKKLSKDKIFDKAIVTEVKPLHKFYPAEEYHQKYFSQNPQNPYCQINISPKIMKLREKFAELLK